MNDTSFLLNSLKKNSPFLYKRHIVKKTSLLKNRIESLTYMKSTSADPKEIEEFTKKIAEARKELAQYEPVQGDHVPQQHQLSILGSGPPAMPQGAGNATHDRPTRSNGASGTQVQDSLGL